MGVEVRMYGDWKYECLKYNVDHYTHTCMSVWNVHIVVYGLCVCRNGYYCMDVLSLQAKHAVAGNMAWGVDGDTGTLADMTELGVWDPLSVKVQTYKTAIEVCVGVWVGVGVHIRACFRQHCV